EVLLQTAARRPFATEEQWLAESGLDLGEAKTALQELQQTGAVVPVMAGNEPVWVTVDGWTAARRRLLAAIDEYHRLYPLRKGIPRGELRSRLQGLVPGGLPVRLFNGLIERAQA